MGFLPFCTWRINQEDFLKDVRWLDNLKLRVGIGVTGNAAVDPYATKGEISSLYLPFNGMSNELGYTTNEQYYVNVADDGVSLANDQLGWEKTTQVNFGLDFGVLNNRLSGSIDA